MMIRIVRFTLTQQASAQAQALADDMISAIQQQPGCLSAVFFGGSDGDCGLSVVWDSQAHADAAYTLMNPKLQGLLAGNVVAPADIRNFPTLANYFAA